MPKKNATDPLILNFPYVFTKLLFNFRLILSAIGKIGEKITLRRAKYFDKTIATYKKEFEIQRPYVLGIKEFKNNSENIDFNIKTITVAFSEKMNPNLMNLRLGPLGEHNLLKITELIGWSEDRKEVTYRIALEKNLRQQLLITDVFRSEKGYLLKPYLIDITTK